MKRHLAALATLALAAGCSSSPATPTAAPSDTTTAPSLATAGCELAEPLDMDLVVPSSIYRGDERVRVHLTACTVDQPEPVSILYLLHGAGADETQWSDVGIFDAADAAVARGELAPTAIVLPDALPNFSCADCAANYERHLLDEIEPAIRKLVPVDTTRRAIGGISRGGGMALRVAGADPASFVAVGGHSAVSARDDALAAIAAAGLPVWLDAGTDDSLLGTSQLMAATLRSLGGDVAQVDWPGHHDRAYWRSHTSDYIAFYAKQLRTDR